MGKFRLDLGDLSVESFELLSRSKPVRGTLFGHEDATDYTDCWGQTCPNCGGSALAFCTADCPTQGVVTCYPTCATCEGQDTCAATCGTCANSCDGWRTCVYECWNPTSYESCDGADTCGQVTFPGCGTGG